MKAPCHDCPDRHPHCHGECERYQTYNAERERIRDKRQLEHEANHFRIIGAKRIREEAYRKK